MQALETGATASRLPSAPTTSVTEVDKAVVDKTMAAQPAGNNDSLAYEQAFSSLKSGRYKQAISDFSEFTAAYPNSTYLPNAFYWLGEASYVNRDFERAYSEFNKVVSRFPTNSRVKDALLKMGFIHYENKQWKKARKFLTMVASKYPRTSAARLADQRLKRMRKEKR